MSGRRSIFIGLIAVMAIFLSGCANNGAKEVQPAEDDAAIILFVSNGCAHCKIVEEFIEKNDVRSKVQFSEKEVSSDESNAALFFKKAEQCGIKKESLGVPFLWTEGRCLTGDKDIIAFFEEQMKK